MSGNRSPELKLKPPTGGLRHLIFLAAELPDVVVWIDDYKNGQKAEQAVRNATPTE